MACKEEQFDVVKKQFKAFGINLNAQHVNGMTPFLNARLLDTLNSEKCLSELFVQLTIPRVF